jgi:hypothetical protein
MKYTLVNETATNAMRLQSIGNVLGTPAIEIKVGSFLLWNFGSKTEVLEIVNETAKTITIKEKTVGTSYVGERKMTKTRLVCILQ